MPTKAYALERGAPKRLKVEWDKKLQDVAVFWDDACLAELTRSDLEAGHRVETPEGQGVVLGVAGAGLFGNVKRVSLHLDDGTAVPGSADDPVEAGKQGGYLLYVIAALNALCGAVALGTGNEALIAAGAGVGSLVMALLFGVLGLFTMRGSRLALGIAMVIYAGDWILGLALSMAAGGTPTIGGLFVRVAFLAGMFQAFRAMSPTHRE